MKTRKALCSAVQIWNINRKVLFIENSIVGRMIKYSFSNIITPKHISTFSMQIDTF